MYENLSEENKEENFNMVLKHTETFPINEKQKLVQDRKNHHN